MSRADSTTRPGISAGRKLVFAAVALLLLLALAEGVARLLARDLPPPPMLPPTLEAYLGSVQHKAHEARYAEREGELPGARGPQVLLRVAKGTADAEPFTGPGGHFVRTTIARLPAGRRILLFGASAAYGDGVTEAQTFARLGEKALQERLGDPSLRLLNMARPAWELASVAKLVERVVDNLSPPPAAVVLMSGNNEFLTAPFAGVGNPFYRESGVYRLALDLFRQKGWLRPPPGWDYERFKSPDWGSIPLDRVQRRVWQGLPGVDDASFALTVRKAHLEGYRATLTRLVASLRKKKIPLVLVPPPLNVSFFVGGVQPQPATFGALGSSGYTEAVQRLRRALDGRGDRATMRKLADDPLAGALPGFLLAQWFEDEGKHAQALPLYRAARGKMHGVLAALPQMAEIAAKQAGDGVFVLRSEGWYRAGEPVRKRSRALFNDSCHLSPEGHKLMARALSPLLARILKPHAPAGPAGDPPADTAPKQ